MENILQNIPVEPKFNNSNIPQCGAFQIFWNYDSHGVIILGVFSLGLWKFTCNIELDFILDISHVMF